MLARAVNPNRDNTEIQDHRQCNGLAAGIEHSPVDVQLIGKRLEQNEGSTDGRELDHV